MIFWNYRSKYFSTIRETKIL